MNFHIYKTGVLIVPNLVPRSFSLAWDASPPSKGKSPGNEVASYLLEVRGFGAS